MQTRLLSVILALTMSSMCSAAITEWTGTRSKGTDWDDLGPDGIRILANGTFKFQSVTSGSVAAIGTNLVDDSVTGTVTLHIERNPADVGSVAGLPGATDVGSIDLINSHMTPTTGNLAFMNITGELGGGGASEVSAITGTVILGNGGFSDGLDDNLNASAGGVNANITIDGFLGSLATLNVGSFRRVGAISRSGGIAR